MKTSMFLLLLATAMSSVSAFHVPSNGSTTLKPMHTSLAMAFSGSDADSDTSARSRRAFMRFVPACVMSLQVASFGNLGTANAITGISDGNLQDIPPDAAKSYLQYRVSLQISADYYVFDLQNMVADIDQWGDISQLFRVNNNRGQGQPSRIERDFVNPMRILLLGMPPDVADEMRDTQFKFEKAMNTISKATSGYRRDLPVEIDQKSIDLAKAGWEDGRVALNQFFSLLNGVTGLNEMKEIPPPGPKQREEYGRSASRYNVLVKKTKLCQNRGGPALSQAWGGLMVSGYLQDSCGIPDLDDYFTQS